MEEDCVPTEYLCAASPGYLRAFARLAQRSLQAGVPSRWRTGCVVPVPKKPRVPLSAKNARGVLLACHTGKIYSRIVRIKIQQLLPEAAQSRQSGGIKGGLTSVPQIVLSFFIEKMRKERKCAAVLFTDIKAAFTSIPRSWTTWRSWWRGTRQKRCWPSFRAQENALTLNMSAGKTEAIVLIQGKQAKEVKRRMFAEGEEDAAILETPAGPLRVVGNFRHLGCRVDCTRTQNAELAARRSSAQAAAVALEHSVLEDRAIPTKVRTCVARSTIHSRLLHQAGKWTCLSKAQLHHLHTRYMAPLRRILG